MCDHFWPIIRVCTMSGRSIFETGHGSHRGAAGSDIYFENVMQVQIFIYPGYLFATCQMELRELKTFLNSLMSVVLYISIDNTGTNVHICINYVN